MSTAAMAGFVSTFPDAFSSGLLLLNSLVSASCVCVGGFFDSVPMAGGAFGFFGLMIPMSAAKPPGGRGGV